MKKTITTFLILVIVLVLVACSSCNNTENTSTTSTITSQTISEIILKGDKITSNSIGATVNENRVTIRSAGTYLISGTLNDGHLIVNTEDQDTVELILNGVDITCSTSAPIYVLNAKNTVITLAEGTENTITDGDSYILEDTTSDEPNAAIFSNDDLTINGSGSLTVNANYNNGIQSKDDLEIIAGNITVNATNDGIKGRDSVIIKGGNINIYASGDGIQSNNNEDSGKGYITIDDGTINITANQDGIQAETSLLINGGNITITSGGGSINSSSNIDQPGNTWGRWDMQNVNNNTSTSSAKGLKASVSITIECGTVNIDSSDDSINSNDSVMISGGNLVLTSGDDGIHSDSTLEIGGGDISIPKSYEGLESAVITIFDGNIHIVSNDDGINVVGGVDNSSINGRPGQNNFVDSGTNILNIYGGYIAVDAKGDGIDVNGPINMTAGTVLINGPTENMNGPIDYSGTFIMSGGFLVAAGSSGMAMAPSTSSTLYSILVNLTSAQSAGTLFHIETGNGEEILTFEPTKQYQSVLLCSSELEKSSTYIVYTGGSSTGTVTDSLYSDGIYTAGTQVTNLTISSTVTTFGSSGGNFPGGGGPRR